VIARKPGTVPRRARFHFVVTRACPIMAMPWVEQGTRWPPQTAEQGSPEMGKPVARSRSFSRLQAERRAQPRAPGHSRRQRNGRAAASAFGRGRQLQTRYFKAVPCRSAILFRGRARTEGPKSPPGSITALRGLPRWSANAAPPAWGAVVERSLGMPLAFSCHYSCYRTGGPGERPPRVPVRSPKWDHASVFAVCGVP